MSNKIKINYYQELLKIRRPLVPLKKIPIPEKRYKVLWKNQNSIICQFINSQSKCFCGHPFKYHQHNTTNPNCTVLNCQCLHFQYIPLPQFNCICGHSYKDHSINNKACNKPKCMKCPAFTSRWVCCCGYKFASHKLSIENYNLNNTQILQDYSTNDKQNQSLIIDESQRLIIQRKKRRLERLNQKLKHKNEYIVNKHSTPFMNRFIDTEQQHIKTPYQLYMQPHHHQFIKLPFHNPQQ